MRNQGKNLKKDTVTISAVGDFCLGGVFPDLNNDMIMPPEIKKKLKADIVFCNLECPFSEKGVKSLSKFGFLWTDSHKTDFLKYAGFNIVSLANNHICDCGYDGLYYTMRLLKKNKIGYVGAGRNLEEARKPQIIRIEDGFSVAVHAYREVWREEGEEEVEEFITATKDHPGVAPLLEDIVREDIKLSKKNNKFVIVSIHWVDQDNQYVARKKIKICQKIISWGADLIIGHHPHVLQGYDIGNKGFIAYSLGNFYFPPYYYKPKEKENFFGWDEEIWRTSAILNIALNGGQIKYNFFPVIQNKGLPTLKVLPNIKSKEIINRLDYLSKAYHNNFYCFYYFYSLIYKYLKHIKRTKKTPERIFKYPFRLSKKIFKRLLLNKLIQKS